MIALALCLFSGFPANVGDFGVTGFGDVTGYRGVTGYGGVTGYRGVTGYGFNVVETSLETSYCGFRYDKAIFPETRAAGNLHDTGFGLGLHAGWPLGLKNVTLYPHAGIDFKVLGFLSPGYSNWQAGLGDAELGFDLAINEKFDFGLGLLVPTGSYYNRLGKGCWSGSAGFGCLIRRLSLGFSLIWTGTNPDGIDAGDGARLVFGYALPHGWMLSSTFSAHLSDTGGPFDPRDSRTLDWSANVSKRLRLGKNWSAELSLEQTLWGIDTEVWTAFKIGILRSSK